MASSRRAKFPPAPDQNARDAILGDLDRNILVEAAAGTGKTTSMVGRMVALLASGTCAEIRTLAAVTFTRKAAAELRSRFQVALEEEVREADGARRERLVAALAKVEQCFVGTIHSFCGRLLRERPVEAGVDISFEEIEPDEDVHLRREAWQELGATLALDGRDGLLDELAGYGLTLADLEDVFISFTDYPDVDEWPAPPPDGDLEEALDRARRRLGPYLTHMRALAPRLPLNLGSDKLIHRYRTLARVSRYKDLSSPVELTELLAEFEGKSGVTQKIWAAEGEFTKPEAKEEGERWDAFSESYALPALRLWREARYAPVLQALHAGREIYDRLRGERGQLNYQDLLLGAAALLGRGPHVRAYFARRFTHLLVDEFHDTDPIQAEAMLLLTATDHAENDWRRCVPRPGSLFVVGDPKQSIYRFRRADIVTYNEVKEILGREGPPLTLSANFRSDPEIIEWVNTVFEPDPADPGDDRVMLRFEGEDSPVSPAYVALDPGKAKVEDRDFPPVVRLPIPGDMNQVQAVPYEADLIARVIRKALDEDGREPGDFMVVTRGKKHLSAYGQAMQVYGIPHQVTGGAALNQVAELESLRRVLVAVTRPDDPVALVAALRGELFGVSDAVLYRFKKAGGTFSFLVDPPAKIRRSLLDQTGPDQTTGEGGPALLNALSLLRKYRTWLQSLPPVSAFEKIAGDLGLVARAAVGPGGDVEAGSLAKALEILRASQQDVWTPRQLVDRLTEIVEVSAEYDGVSARSGADDRSLVRVMNLHKVKGLEAPVVFLACPYGENIFGPRMHVDRSGGKVLGYMTVSISRGWKTVKLAQPAGWEDRAAREAAFDRAEQLRLRYVAATRAGSSLIVTGFESKNQRNPWKSFLAHLPESAVVEDPGEREAPPRKKVRVTREEPVEGARMIAANLEEASVPTYRAGGAKALAMGEVTAEPGKSEPRDAPRWGERGLAWGSTIHRLLEALMSNPGLDLLPLARACLEEHDLDSSVAMDAVTCVRAVMKSDLWQRAQASDACYSEIPFQIMKEGADLPTMVRGSIDLVFREEGGWVLVDYKTDSLKGKTVEELAAYYAPQLGLYAEAWERCTGEKVRWAGVFHTGTGRTAPIDFD